MKSLLIKLPNWMGDILFSLDVLHTLSCHFDRLALLVSSELEELFRIFPVRGSEVIAYPGEHWPSLNRDTILQIERFAPDAGLLLPNSIASAIALRYAGISHLIGYSSEHRGFLLHQSARVPSRRMHQTEYYRNLLRLFNIEPVPYPVAASDMKNSAVLIHPGASKIERAWHLERFLKVADLLKGIGMDVIFVSGAKVTLSGYPLVTAPSITEFAGMLRTCSLFIGNDSGPLHLAQQCGVPVVGIYGPGSLITTGPRPISRFRVVHHGFPCSPCRQRFFKDCNPSPAGKPYCIETISTQEIFQAATQLLDTKKGNPV